MEDLRYRLDGVVLPDNAQRPYYEGPLDAILTLLAKNKIAIKDIQIASLVEQYLARLEEMKRMDLEVAGEFIAMASHLIYLKTRMLLSAAQDAPDEELDRLMQALEERRRQEDMRAVQVGLQFLTARAERVRLIFIKPPEEIEKDKPYTLTHSVEVLAALLAQMQGRALLAQPLMTSAFVPLLATEEVSVEEAMRTVMDKLAQKGRMCLSRLLLSDVTRAQRVATFLAVLEICRNRLVDIQERGGDYELSLLASVAAPPAQVSAWT